MRIVQVGSYPLDITHINGGVEASVYGISMEQAKSHRVFVIDVPRCEIKNDYTEEFEGVTIYRFTKNGRNNYYALTRLLSIVNIIRSLKPDISHIHTTSLFAFFTFLLVRFHNIPAIVTVHGLAHIEKKNEWNKNRNVRNFIKYIAQSLTEFLFLSITPKLIVDTPYVTDTIRLYKKQLKIFRMPFCSVIPQGIDQQFFNLKNTSEKHKLLSVGSINKRKGYLILIESMVKIKKRIPDVSLSIVGALSDPTYYQLMVNSIKEKGLENTICIYPNASLNEIVNFYTNAEIFVLSTEEESQGIVFCEAMAAGLPVVTTNVGGVPWIVKDHVNGFLSEFGDRDSFADNVIKLIENESLRKKMGETNLRDSHKYEWKQIAKEILDVYKTVKPPTPEGEEEKRREEHLTPKGDVWP